MNEPEWIEHDGSAGCPVPEGCDVEVEWQSGLRVTLDDGHNIRWVHIKRYRLVTPAQQQAGAEVPEWALLKAFNLTYSDDARDMASSDASKIDDMRGLFVGNAFARYIAAHEPAPVDPLAEAVKASFAHLIDLDGADLRDVLTELRARGVTLTGSR